MDIKREGKNGFTFAWVCRENLWMICKKLITWVRKWVGRDMVSGDICCMPFYNFELSTLKV